MRPNILFLTDDQHRFDAYGSTGVFPTLETPSFDRLRHEGTVFSQMYASCPICVPARFTFHTGLYPSQGAAALLKNAISWPDRPTVMQALQRAGYHTSLVGKIHSHSNAGSELPADLTDPAHVARAHALGYDDVFEVCGKSLAYTKDCRWTKHLESKGLLERYREDLVRRRSHRSWNEPYSPSLLPEEDHMDTFIADHAVKWIEQVRTDKPFFLHASFCGPHYPIDPPAPLFEKYRAQDMPEPAGVDDPVEREYWQELRASYCALIEHVDRQIGRVLEALEKCSLLDNTVIVYLSDHGDRIGDCTSYNKGQPEDGSARTPMIIRAPKQVSAGAENSTLCNHVDVAPTLMAIGGVTEALEQALPGCCGLSLWETAQSGSNLGREATYSETSNWRMSISDKWKYIYGLSDKLPERLHSRDSDPHDLNNLATDPEHGEVLSEMRRSLIHGMAPIVAPNPPEYWERREAMLSVRSTEERPTQIPRVPVGKKT